MFCKEKPVWGYFEVEKFFFFPDIDEGQQGIKQNDNIWTRSSNESIGILQKKGIYSPFISSSSLQTGFAKNYIHFRRKLSSRFQKNRTTDWEHEPIGFILFISNIVCIYTSWVLPAVGLFIVFFRYTYAYIYTSTHCIVWILFRTGYIFVSPTVRPISRYLVSPWSFLVLYIYIQAFMTQNVLILWSVIGMTLAHANIKHAFLIGLIRKE